MNDFDENDEEFVQMQLVYLDETRDKITDFVDKLFDAYHSGVEGFDVDETFRLVHGLKGTAGTYGFRPVSDIASVLETLLSFIRDKKIVLTIDSLSFIIDSLELIAEVFCTMKSNYVNFRRFDIEKNDCLERFRKIVFKTPEIAKLIFKKEKIKDVPSDAKFEERKPCEGGSSKSEAKASAIVAYNAKFTKNIIKNCLEEFDYEIYETKSAIEVLERLCEKKYDLVVTFQVLEKLNGQSLTAAIKLCPEYFATKVVFLTSNKHLSKNQFMVRPDYFLVVDDNLNENISGILKELNP